MGPLSGNNDIHVADERIEDLELSGPVTTIALDDPVFMRPSASPVPNVFSEGTSTTQRQAATSASSAQAPARSRLRSRWAQ